MTLFTQDRFLFSSEIFNYDWAVFQWKANEQYFLPVCIWKQNLELMRVESILAVLFSEWFWPKPIQSYHPNPKHYEVAGELSASLQMYLFHDRLNFHILWKITHVLWKKKQNQQETSLPSVS